VHHGRLFATAPPPGSLPTPQGTSPSTPRGSGTSSPQLIEPPLEDATKKIYPYLCFGFKIADAVVYISDVSHIPEDTWSILEEPSPNWVGSVPVFICDCLRLHPHTSHFGLKEAVAVIRRLGATRTYLTGFGHEVSHDEYVRIGEVAGQDEQVAGPGFSEIEKRGVELMGPGKPVWMRPAYDGLKVLVSSEGTVRDECYH
jgi:phosphoribosyl 1,2-cyclic phosphodiesterase